MALVGASITNSTGGPLGLALGGADGIGGIALGPAAAGAVHGGGPLPAPATGNSVGGVAWESGRKSQEPWAPGGKPGA